MADENIGIVRALWRFVTFYGLRKRMGLVRAADRLFTGSADGISDAYDIHRDQLVRRYNELLNAVANTAPSSTATIGPARTVTPAAKRSRT